MSDPLSPGARGDRDEQGGIAWGLVLLWFMRIVAAVWIVKGLGSWMIILGTDPMGHSLQNLPPPQRGVVIVFSVLDLVAGVGLWLTSAWGGVMWLLAVMTDLSAFALGAATPNSSPLFIGLEVALVICYLVLSWLASRSE
ncbi:MAG: hypothetical protein U1E62_11300 [Alsobacter sp.]